MYELSEVNMIPLGLPSNICIMSSGLSQMVLVAVIKLQLRTTLNNPIAADIVPNKYKF